MLAQVFERKNKLNSNCCTTAADVESPPPKNKLFREIEMANRDSFYQVSPKRNSKKILPIHQNGWNIKQLKSNIYSWLTVQTRRKIRPAG